MFNATHEGKQMTKKMVCGIMRDLEAEAKAYANRTEQIILASKALRQAHIARTCARFELESDEFTTREQKAILLIKTGNA